MSAIRIFDKFKNLLDVSWGSIADGQALKRSGLNIVGADMAAGGLPMGYISGFVILNSGADATNDLYFGPGVCRSDDNTADIVITVGIYKRIDAVWAAGTNQGGRDPAWAQANVWWNCYAIRNPTTGVCDVFITRNVGASVVLPSGFTQKRRIGSRNFSGGWYACQQMGNDYVSYNTVQGNVVDGNVASGSYSAALGASAPANLARVVQAHIQISAYSTAGSISVDVRTNFQSTGLGYRTSGANLWITADLYIWVDDSSTYAWAHSGTAGGTAHIWSYTKGWIDYRNDWMYF